MLTKLKIRNFVFGQFTEIIIVFDQVSNQAFSQVTERIIVYLRIQGLWQDALPTARRQIRAQIRALLDRSL